MGSANSIIIPIDKKKKEIDNNVLFTEISYEIFEDKIKTDNIDSFLKKYYNFSYTEDKIKTDDIDSFLNRTKTKII